MHAEARSFVARTLAALPPRESVIEIGARFINGDCRDLIDGGGRGAEYTGLDLLPGRNVDVVGDAAEYEPPEPVDTVLCLETLEHCADPAALCKAAHRWLKPGGIFLITAADEGRPPHSGIDGMQIRPGEEWREVREIDLTRWLKAFKDVTIETDGAAHDIYAIAVKAKR